MALCAWQLGRHLPASLVYLPFILAPPHAELLVRSALLLVTVPMGKVEVLMSLQVQTRLAQVAMSASAPVKAKQLAAASSLRLVPALSVGM